MDTTEIVEQVSFFKDNKLENDIFNNFIGRVEIGEIKNNILSVEN